MGITRRNNSICLIEVLSFILINHLNSWYFMFGYILSLLAGDLKHMKTKIICLEESKTETTSTCCASKISQCIAMNYHFTMVIC